MELVESLVAAKAAASAAEWAQVLALAPVGSSVCVTVLLMGERSDSGAAA